MKKRGLLIATGTIGGMSAVFAVTPPQFGNTASGLGDSGATSTATQTPQATPAPTASAGGTTAPAPSKSATPAPAATPAATSAAPAPTKAATGSVTVTGSGFEAYEARRGQSWGLVKVKVTFTDGVISAVSATQSPMSRAGMAFSSINPYVQGQKITVAQINSTAADALPYVSGVSYTSIAYWDSLKSAISKAGL